MAYEQIAAVDMGSNSFRLEIGRVVDDHIYSLDSLKDSIRLASGLDADGTLSEESQARALETLSRYGERIRELHPEAVRAVATNTLRVAKNAKAFLQKAEAALGFPIEVISGREEARLIYIGAAHTLPLADYRRLVVDIGGGSTEFIIGQKIEPLLMESLHMGCVVFSRRFFGDGKVDKKRFHEAETAAARELETIAGDYHRLGWVEAAGSSGTAHALSDLFDANQMNPEGFVGVSREALFSLREQLIRAGSCDKLKLNQLPEDRFPVLPGGIAIMCAIFESLGLERMVYSEGALRLGVLYDLLGRAHHHDMRDVTVTQFVRRYQVDAHQVERVQHTALQILNQLSNLALPQNEPEGQFLRWAVALHEIGISVAQSGFHKHGAYIVSNGDMPGFSKKDQERLAQILLGQRGKLERVRTISQSDTINEATWRLIFCLRLAALLHRSRSDQPLPIFFVKQNESGFQIEIPMEWLAKNPLSAAALSDETRIWETVGLKFTIKRKKSLV